MATTFEIKCPLKRNQEMAQL